MKFIHISDLHLGKRVLEYSMIENQAYLLEQIVGYLNAHKINVLLISGDVYDTSIPSQEAVNLLDQFIHKLHQHHIVVLMISGNHDSSDRLNFGSTLFDEQGIYIRTQLHQIDQPVVLNDEQGPVHFYMLPFCKPHHVRDYFKVPCSDYNQMMKLLVEKMQVDFTQRNVLLSHQFVLGKDHQTETSDSEVYSLGGIDEISYQWLENFDYVALGHVHKAQRIQKESIRYSGSILKYSISERHHHKSMVEVNLKDDFEYQLIPLTPKQDLVEIKGNLKELLENETAHSQDFVHVILTDDQKQAQALYQLKNKFPYLLQLSYHTSSTQETSEDVVEIQIDEPYMMFQKFYQQQCDQPLDETQRKYLQQLFQEVK